MYGTNANSVNIGWNGTTKANATYFKNLTPTANGSVTMTANWGTGSPVTLSLSNAGYTCSWNTKADGSGTSYAAGSSYTPPAGVDSVTLYAICEGNNYNVEYESSNLLYGMEDVGSTTNAHITYSISDGVVTVIGDEDYEGYGAFGYTNGRVYLEANKEYIFSCTTDTTWGTTTGTVEAWLMLDGALDVSYNMTSNNNYTFTPTTSGIYWLRFDVNEEGRTATFSDVSIRYNVSSSTEKVGTAYGTLPTYSETYTVSFVNSTSAMASSTSNMTATPTFNGWYTAQTGGTNITASSIVTIPNDHTLYAQLGTVSALTLPTLTLAGYTCRWNTSSDGSGISYDSGGSYTPKATSTLYAVCTINKVNMTYNANGGTVTGGLTQFTQDSSGNVLSNGSLLISSWNYGSTAVNLPNWNNTGWLNITKSGHSAKAGYEWNTKADGSGTSYNHDTDYNHTAVCDASVTSCTVKVYVNWVAYSVSVLNSTVKVCPEDRFSVTCSSERGYSYIKVTTSYSSGTITASYDIGMYSGGTAYAGSCNTRKLCFTTSTSCTAYGGECCTNDTFLLWSGTVHNGWLSAGSSKTGTVYIDVDGSTPKGSYRLVMVNTSGCNGTTNIFDFDSHSTTYSFKIS